MGNRAGPSKAEYDFMQQLASQTSSTGGSAQPYDTMGSNGENGGPIRSSLSMMGAADMPQVMPQQGGYGGGRGRPMDRMVGNQGMLSDMQYRGGNNAPSYDFLQQFI
jgi:hypothetical protein